MKSTKILSKKAKRIPWHDAGCDNRMKCLYPASGDGSVTVWQFKKKANTNQPAREPGHKFPLT